MAAPEWIARNPAAEDFVYTEFFVDRAEPLPRARFGTSRFMWGCIAFATAFVAWMAGRH